MVKFDLKPTTTNIVFMLSLIVLLVAIGPILTIWALNTLFPVVNLAYTFTNWCAIVILHAFLTTVVGKR